MKLFYLPLLVILFGCSSVDSNNTTTLMPSQLPSPSATATSIPISTTTPVATPTNTISACWHMRNILVCNMSYSIVVHSAQKDWLAKLLPVLNDEYVDLTYEELASNISAGYPPLDNYVLISIDDLSTYYLPSRFYEMIENMRDHNMVGTLAIVTEYPQPPDPEIWAYYRELQAEGWEIAIHTEHHYNFKWISNAQIRLEIETSYEKICQNTLRCPVTLVLPFGEGLDLAIVYAVARELGIIWIVGTDKLLDRGFPGYSGNYFFGDPPYYVSRAAIVENIDEMLEILEERFPFMYSYENE